MVARNIAKEQRRLERIKRAEEKFARDQEKIEPRKKLADLEIETIRQENKVKKKAEKTAPASFAIGSRQR